MVKAEILEQIFNRVVTKATSPVSHYLGTVNLLIVGNQSEIIWIDALLCFK